MPMTPRAGLQVADDLAAFIETEVLPGLDIHADRFWTGAAGVFARFAPENRRLLAVRDDRLLAFGWTKVADPDEGEVYALGVDPGAQGQRLGPALTARMLAHLAGRGVRRVVLYTEGDNHAAIRVYRAAGFERSAVDVVYRA